MRKLRTRVRRQSSVGAAAAQERAVAWRVYEVCVSKGYVDGRDWFAADAEVRAEVRRPVRSAFVRGRPGR
jgi:hypothetical protein